MLFNTTIPAVARDLFGVKRSVIQPNGPLPEERVLDSFIEYSARRVPPVTIYNFENYMRDGLQMVLNGDTDGIGLIGLVANENRDEAWFLLGCLYSYGVGVERNLAMGDYCFECSGYKEYKAKEVAAVEEEVFYKQMWAFVQSMTNSIIVKQSILNDTYNNGNYNPYSGSSPSGSSSGTKCSRCGGTGVCKSCGNKGGSMEYVDDYTGSGAKSWISCGECNGLKHCRVCHGRGYIY